MYLLLISCILTSSGAIFYLICQIYYLPHDKKTTFGSRRKYLQLINEVPFSFSQIVNYLFALISHSSCLRFVPSRQFGCVYILIFSQPSECRRADRSTRSVPHATLYFNAATVPFSTHSHDCMISPTKRNTARDPLFRRRRSHVCVTTRHQRMSNSTAPLQCSTVVHASNHSAADG